MSVSAVFLAAGGSAVLLGVTRQLVGCRWAGATGFRYVGSIGPLAIDRGQTRGSFNGLETASQTRLTVRAVRHRHHRVRALMCGQSK